jgi:predicted AAA+ superfamily ATPase
MKIVIFVERFIMINRQLEQNIQNSLGKGKAIIITGPRQVGKTTLVKLVAQKIDQKSIYLNCDQIEVKDSLSIHSLSRLRDIIGKNQIVIIDEAQRVKDIGLTLKLIIDNSPTFPDWAPTLPRKRRAGTAKEDS